MSFPSQCLYLFKFYSLIYDSEGFGCVLLSENKLKNLRLAKIHCLSSYNFGKDFVPVISMDDRIFYFYHPRHRVWYTDLSVERLYKLFSFLVPSAGSAAFGDSSNVVGPV